MLARYLLILSAFFCSALLSLVYSCTTVFSNSEGHPYVVGRTTDLDVSDTPIIKILPRGMERNGEAGSDSVTWKSKYGSVVVTAFHTNAVTDGMNEKGLAVHLLYLPGKTYPVMSKNAKRIANVLLSQYILDNYTTVDEALKGSQDLQLVAAKMNNKVYPIHLSIQDKSGDAAVVEFFKGKIQIYHGRQYQVMTNDPVYDIQLENLQHYKGFGGQLSLPGEPDPLSRFVRASTFLKTLAPPSDNVESIAGVLSVIRSVMVPFGAVDTSGSNDEHTWATRWVSVADVTNAIYYFNSTSMPNIIWINLNNMDLSIGAPVLWLDPNDIHLEGDVTSQFKNALS